MEGIVMNGSEKKDEWPVAKELGPDLEWEGYIASSLAPQLREQELRVAECSAQVAYHILD